MHVVESNKDLSKAEIYREVLGQLTALFVDEQDGHRPGCAAPRL
jgi:hypothetical protein